MKKIAILLFTLIFFAIGGAAYADLNDGLVTYYPFNGNASDESGNGNDGTVIGATLTADRFGRANSAYSFDGINDYIKASADNLPTAERTVSLWFFAKSNGRFVHLAYGGGSCGTSWFMGTNAWGQPILYMSSHCNVNTIKYYYPKPPVGDWYHFVVATDENGTRIYINGEEKASNSHFVTNTNVLNKDLSIGVDVSPSGIAPYVDGNVRYHDGMIDDVRIYNRALSESEIWDLYQIDPFTNNTNLKYTPVTPCRIVDTRKTSAGMIDANTQRNFRVYGSVGGQGGNLAGCPSPGDQQPLAAHINMVAVNPTGKGNLQAFPVGAGTGAGLSVNYNTIDTNLANAGTVKAVTGSGPDITVASNFSSAHTVIDVLGYYYPDEGFYYTPVDPCRIVDTRKTSAGIIDADTERDFRVFGSVGDQGGDPAGCPSTLGVSPEAAHLNMVAVNPTGKGNLQAFPVGAGAGAGLSVNYNTIDTNLANAGTVKTVTGSGPDITVASNFSSAHTVIDVLGYYSEEEDLLYTPVTPCRIVDTRKTSAGIIDADTERCFRVYGSVGSQGGNAGGCSSPLGQPLAAHINMVAVNPIGKGNLQAFPVGAGAGAGLSVNYNTIDTNLANAGTVKTVTGAGLDICVASNFSSAHTVIDVLGYYYPAP